MPSSKRRGFAAPSLLAFCLLGAVTTLGAQDVAAPEGASPAVLAATGITPNVISVTVGGRDVFVADSAGARPTIRLSLGDMVRASEARGRVAVLITSLRIMFFADGQPDAPEYRWGLSEACPSNAALGTRVAAAVSGGHFLLFDGDQARLHEVDRLSSESVEKVVLYENVACLATDRRLLGLIAGSDAPVETKLGLNDHVGRVNPQVGIITVTTYSRVLRLRLGDSAWVELASF